MNKKVWDTLLYGKEYIVFPTGWYHLRHGYLYHYRLCKPWPRKLALPHKIGKRVL